VIEGIKPGTVLRKLVTIFRRLFIQNTKFIQVNKSVKIMVTIDRSMTAFKNVEIEILI